MKKLCVIAIIMLFVCAIWAIAHIPQNLFTVNTYLQSDPDSLLFARFCEESILKGEVQTTDSYGCFPYTINHKFNFYISLLLKFNLLLYLLFPSLTLKPIITIGFLPIIFTVLSWLLITIGTYYLTKNKPLTLFCAFFSLPNNLSIMIGELTKIDYDFIIYFCIWFWIISCVNYINSKARILIIASTFISAFFLLIWSAAPFFYFFITVYGIFLWYTDSEKHENYLNFSSATMFFGALITISVLILRKASLAFAITEITYFQPVCLITGAAFLYLLSFFKKLSSNAKFCFKITLFLAVVIFTIIFSSQISESSGIIFNKDPIHANIAELQSLQGFSSLAKDNSLLTALIHYFGWHIILLPFAAFYMLRSHKDNPGLKTLIHWLLFIFTLACYQTRYMRWIGIGSGLYTAIIFYMLWNNLKAHFYKQNNLKLSAVLIFVPVMIFTSIQNFASQKPQNPISRAFSEACLWINENTAQTSGFFDSNKPEYGILTYWDTGNMVAFYTRRPVTTNNAMWGYKTMADIYSSKTEKEAYELCKKYKIKYIFFTPREYTLKRCGFWPMFKDKPETPEYKMITSNLEYHEDFKEWFYFWLLRQQALGKHANFDAGSNFRMVYAHNNPDKNTFNLPEVIIFEVTDGSPLAIEADAGTEVTAKLTVDMAGFKSPYTVSKTADSNGKVTLNLAYPTDFNSGNIKTHSEYEITYTINNECKTSYIKLNQAGHSSMPAASHEYTGP